MGERHPQQHAGEDTTMTLILNVTSNPEHVAALEHSATLHGQQDAEEDYADARRYLELLHFNMDEWITGAATAATDQAFGDSTADDPTMARALYGAAFTAAYRVTMQHLEQQGG
jgi:hypothetical protein